MNTKKCKIALNKGMSFVISLKENATSYRIKNQTELFYLLFDKTENFDLQNRIHKNP